MTEQFNWQVWVRGGTEPTMCRAPTETKALAAFEDAYKALKVLTPSQRKKLRMENEKNEK
jgi:hypothetical protein